MDIVVMATDLGLECQPLTVATPPALLRVLDKSILERNLDALDGLTDKVLIVAGMWTEAIRDTIGDQYRKISIAYSDDLESTGGLRLQGNTLYSRSALAAAVAGDATDLDAGALRVKYPWNLLEANVDLLRKTACLKKGIIDDGVVVLGEIIIEEGAVIRSGSYIEGPAYFGRDVRIGPFAHIRPDTVIERGCEIGKAELYDCVIMRGTTCKHQAYVGHSVVGQNVNIGAGLITADYRHDGVGHATVVAGKKIETGRRKLGAFIGDDVKTGIGTLIYPGRKIWPGLGTLPGEVVSGDKIV